MAPLGPAILGLLDESAMERAENRVEEIADEPVLVEFKCDVASIERRFQPGRCQTSFIEEPGLFGCNSRSICSVTSGRRKLRSGTDASLQT